MKSYLKMVHFLSVAVFVCAGMVSSALAEETKNFFSWNSNFIKKSENKNKGIPANPPKKKLKGIATQPSKGSANDALTEEEKKAIRAMSLGAATELGDTTGTLTKRPANLQAPRAPRVPQTPKLFVIPQDPNRRVGVIPSPPTAFSSNNAANSAVARASDPNRQ